MCGEHQHESDILSMILFVCLFFALSGKPLSVCDSQRQGVLRDGAGYLPRCNANGTFDFVQCHHGICFCVDRNGLHRKGTGVNALRYGKPHCDDPGKIRDYPNPGISQLTLSLSQYFKEKCIGGVMKTASITIFYLSKL